MAGYWAGDAGAGAGGDPVEPFASSTKVSGLYLEGSGELGSVWEC